MSTREVIYIGYLAALDVCLPRAGMLRKEVLTILGVFFSESFTIFLTPANNLLLICSQRAWLLKLLALELHLADMASTAHKETCLAILSRIYVQSNVENYSGPNLSDTSAIDAGHVGNRAINSSKVLF